MARMAAVLALAGFLVSMAGCDNNATTTNGQTTSTTGATTGEADSRPLFGPCATGKAVGVDRLTCKEANAVLAKWSTYRYHDIGSTLRPCRRASAGFDHLAGDGISCTAVDDFVAHQFAPHPPGWVERSGGATCRIDEGGKGLLVTCRQRGRWFAFSFT